MIKPTLNTNNGGKPTPLYSTDQVRDIARQVIGLLNDYAYGKAPAAISNILDTSDGNLIDVATDYLLGVHNE